MNKAVEAGWSTRFIALGLCPKVVVLIGFAIEAATRSSGGTADPHSSAMSRPLVGFHVTRSHAETATEELNRNQAILSGEIESLEAPPPTRSTFMAKWQRVPGATGYRLDVALDPSFRSFVRGFQDLDVGDVAARLVTGLKRGTSYYYRVRPYNGTSTSAASPVMSAATAGSIGLTIHASFDSSIASRSNAGNIEGAISRAIGVYESLFSDQITIEILFRYSTTGPDGSALPSDALSRSDFPYYRVPWQTYINALLKDAITGYDATANTSLPGNAWSTYIDVSSSNGRAVGLDTPGAPFPGGAFGDFPYDGIVTLNSAPPFQFYRPTVNGNFDAQRSIEHEVDEILGFGSRLGVRGSDFRPQDLFSWSSPGVRNVSPTGTRYFSIDHGNTRIVYFNQNSHGDYGDWLSTTCPQVNPSVQNAFSCADQYSDVTLASPEAINLDVIGYNLINSPAPAPTDFNGDRHPDLVLYNGSTRQTVIWYLNNNVLLGGSVGPTLTAGWRLVGVADLNRDGHPDYLLFNPTTRQTIIAYLSGGTLVGSAYGPTIPGGWEPIAAADFNKDGKPDLLLYNAQSQQTVVWYLNNNVLLSGELGDLLPADYQLVGVADFNRDGHPDYALFNPRTLQTLIWYVSGPKFLFDLAGPTLPAGWQLVGTADFNGDGMPDYLLYNPSTRQTVIWYLDSSLAHTGSASGPTLPGGWTVAAP